MGPSLLLQWTFSPPPGNLSDIIMARLLEHYSLSQPMRSQIQFRTYRTASTSSPTSVRLLTTITYTTPLPVIRENTTYPIKDDTTYLFLEDRSPAPIPKSEPIEIDGFELMEIPPDTPLPSSQGNTSFNLPDSVKTEMAKGSKGLYRMIAVKPSSNVLGLFQNLLSPFVMGSVKSARAAALTTAQSAAPTPLPGTPFQLNSLHLPPLPPPHPPLTLTLHTLSNSVTMASTIFLEAEYPGQKDVGFAMSVLKEFLEGCLPDPISGDRVWHEWKMPPASGPGSSTQDDDGWEGIERNRRMTMLLARCLRESSYI